MDQKKLAAGIVLGLAAAATSAAAQDVRKLDITAQARVEHQSNVSQTTKEQAALRGLTLEDTIFTPNVSIDYVQPVGRQSLFLRGNLGYAFYQDNDSLNREQLDLNGGLKAAVGPCVVTLSGGYTRGLNRIDDPTLITDVENIQETKRAAVDAACARQTGIGVVGGYSKDWTTNDLELSKFTDADREAMTLGVTYSRPALGTFTVFGNSEEVVYPNRLIEDGYDLASLGVSYERELGARIQGRVSIAYASVDPHAPALPGLSDEDFETTAYSADLSYRASSRLRFRGAFERSVTPAAGIGRTFDLTESYEVYADYDLGSRISFNLAAMRVDRDAKGGILLPLLQLTESRTDNIGGMARYKLSERLSFNIFASHEERSTNAPQFDYTNDRFGAGVEARF